MPFPVDLVQQAWERAEGRCECACPHHSHSFRRCNEELKWEKRGCRGAPGAWQIIAGDGRSAIDDQCEILCWECYNFIRSGE